jgi:hypothetical protein
MTTTMMLTTTTTTTRPQQQQQHGGFIDEKLATFRGTVAWAISEMDW